MAYIYQDDYDDYEELSPVVLVSFSESYDSIAKVPDRMVANAAVHAEADFLIIPDLQTKAKNRFREMAKDCWNLSPENLAKVLGSVFGTPANNMTDYQDAVVSVCVWRAEELTTKEEYVDILKSYPEFVIRLLSAVHIDFNALSQSREQYIKTQTQELNNIRLESERRELQTQILNKSLDTSMKRLNRLIKYGRGSDGKRVTKPGKSPLRDLVRDVIVKIQPYTKSSNWPEENDRDSHGFTDGRT